MSANFSSLPTGLLIGIVVLAIIEVALLAVAIVLNLKTPQSRLTLPRIAWLAISLFIGFIGPIAFFIAGRRKEKQPMEAAGPSDANVYSTIEELYK